MFTCLQDLQTTESCRHLFLQCSGAVSRPEDAEQTCHALNDSGQVLLYQDKAYLRPAEVAEMVLQALPDTTKDLEDKLTILHKELQPLEDLKKGVDKHAHRLALPS